MLILPKTRSILYSIIIQDEFTLEIMSSGIVYVRSLVAMVLLSNIRFFKHKVSLSNAEVSSQWSSLPNNVSPFKSEEMMNFGNNAHSDS